MFTIHEKFGPEEKNKSGTQEVDPVTDLSGVVVSVRIARLSPGDFIRIGRETKNKQVPAPITIS